MFHQHLQNTGLGPREVDTLRNSVINFAIQIGNDNGTPSQSIVRAVAYAIQSGLIVVVAAGNSGPYAGTMNRVATLPGVISVGASDFGGTRIAEFSSRGWPMAPRSGPTVVAPGEHLITSWNESEPKRSEQAKLDEEIITPWTLQQQMRGDYSDQNIAILRKSFTAVSGTSFSCSYVSGLMIKFVEMRHYVGLPHRSEHAIEFLRRVSKKIPGYGDHEQGYGFVSNALVQEYLETVSPDDPFWAGNWSPPYMGKSQNGLATPLASYAQTTPPLVERRDFREMRMNKVLFLHKLWAGE